MATLYDRLDEGWGEVCESQETADVGAPSVLVATNTSIALTREM
jgi:hypothetical protein